MRVLSLFDGISCGYQALKNLGIDIEEYYAYEIDETAIKISNKNHPAIIQCGDVRTADFKQYYGFDLLLGGSPCQDLSITKSKTREGLEGKNSSLFWCYKRALDEVKPRYFLFENVGNMREKDKEIITEALGVKPIMINSSMFLPQNRERYYWTNIPRDTIPQIRKMVFRELMEETVKEKYYYKKPFTLEADRTKNVIATVHLNAHEISKRVYNPDGIIGCLTCVSGGYQEKKVYDDKQNRVRKLTPIEYERLQGLPDNYTEGVCDSKRYTVCGNGWTIPVIEYLLSGTDTTEP